ncbi:MULTISPECIES: hypothetical protein [Streptomyces]|uniref:hypothetical protein n=1 Tax=Streptomyces TaxID=1883 RepID=UPI0036B15E28
MPNQPASEDGEPSSVVEKAKSLFRKNSELIVGGALVAAGLLAVALAKMKDAPEGLGHLEGLPDFGGLKGVVEPPAPVSERPQRKSADEHWVNEHTRMAKNGPITIERYRRCARAA